MERTGDGSLRPFVFMRKEYYGLDDNHFFLDQRVQLIGGVIFLESPMSPPHAVAVRLVTKAIERVFGDGYDVRAQLPLDLGLISEPHPDVAVVLGSPRDYLSDHPKTAALVVEVSDTTIESDRVLVFRNPAPDAGSKFGRNYASVSAHGRPAGAPIAAPAGRVLPGDLLP